MRILFVSASADETFKCKDAIWNRKPRRKYVDTAYSFCTQRNNTESLASLYNGIIAKGFSSTIEWVVFVHADAVIDTIDIEEKLTTLGEKYDVIGVAGTSSVKIEAPCLWHLMGRGFLHGSVAHTLPGHQKSMTYFGPYPNRVVLIDGVFMAVKVSVLKNVKFDENCPSKFHFYDLIFSMDCHKAGYSVGVGDIMVTHDSPGLREFTPEFLAGQEYFLKKYANA